MTLIYILRPENRTGASKFIAIIDSSRPPQSANGRRGPCLCVSVRSCSRPVPAATYEKRPQSLRASRYTFETMKDSAPFWGVKQSFIATKVTKKAPSAIAAGGAAYI